MIWQKEIVLKPYSRGFHLITDIIQAELPSLPEAGMLNVYIKHTSAGLTITENADPKVGQDFENFLNKLLPDDYSLYTHTVEGIDDMPAHIKSTFTGHSLMIPITGKKLNLGTWQGIFLCEFRNQGGPRKIVITLYS